MNNNLQWPKKGEKAAPRKNNAYKKPQPEKKGIPYKCEDVTKKTNMRLNPKAIQIKNSCREMWEAYGTKLQYTPSGKVEYVCPTVFNVDYFDQQDKPPDSLSTIVIGKRRTGKTVLTKWLIYNWRDMFEEIYVFTKTKVNDWYQSWVPECFVYEGYQEDVAEMIWERARRAKWMEKHKGGKPPKILVICDDLLSDKSHRFDETLNALYTAGRHVGISVVYISQKFKGVVPAIRDNSDLVFSFPMFNQNEAKQLSEEFMGGMNVRTGMELLDLYANQENHTCLVVETWRNCRDPDRFLKFCKADEMDWLRIDSMNYSKEYKQAAAEIMAHRESEEEQEMVYGASQNLITQMRSLGIN